MAGRNAAVQKYDLREHIILMGVYGGVGIDHAVFLISHTGARICKILKVKYGGKRTGPYTECFQGERVRSANTAP
jgi:hypothetical protein